MVQRFVYTTVALFAVSSLLIVAGCSSPQADQPATENGVPVMSSGQAQPGMQGAKLTVPANKRDKDGH